jgi:hypothetical protein
MSLKDMKPRLTFDATIGWPDIVVIVACIAAVAVGGYRLSAVETLAKETNQAVATLSVENSKDHTSIRETLAETRGTLKTHIGQTKTFTP